MIPDDVLRALQDIDPHLSAVHGSRLSGGDINDVFTLQNEQFTYCLKVNEISRYPSMFKREAQGLQLLRENSDFVVPEVITTGQTDQRQFLLMEFIRSGNPKSDFWEDFGHKLATMHRQSADQFGLTNSNYIGSLPQSNVQHENWSEFYAEERLLPLTRSAIDQGLLSQGTGRQMDQLCLQLNHLFPNESPSLLHGDLWSGNFMIDHLGNPVLIDPAVYYGHREMDLGMTLLFGGFGATMYEAYQESWPLESGWRSRVQLCQLFPLLVHVLLFGRSYAGQVERIVENYTR